jgi:hypothetical protein
MEDNICCINCIHFRSWKELYDNDEMEPDDSGKCMNPINPDLGEDDVIVEDAYVDGCISHEKINIK